MRALRDLPVKPRLQARPVQLRRCARSSPGWSLAPRVAHPGVREDRRVDVPLPERLQERVARVVPRVGVGVALVGRNREQVRPLGHRHELLALGDHRRGLRLVVGLAGLLGPHRLDALREVLLQAEQLAEEVLAALGDQGAPEAQVVGEVAVELDDGRLEAGPRLGLDGLGELLLGLDLGKVGGDLVEGHPSLAARDDLRSGPPSVGRLLVVDRQVLVVLADQRKQVRVVDDEHPVGVRLLRDRRGRRGATRRESARASVRASMTLCLPWITRSVLRATESRGLIRPSESTGQPAEGRHRRPAAAQPGTSPRSRSRPRPSRR